MSLKPVALGFALGFLLALSPACGTKQCSASTCSSGCCDTKGDCQLGNSASACGQLGGLCNVCQLGTACNLGTCMSNNLGGGGGPGGGGGQGGGGMSGGGATGGGAATGGGTTGGGTTGGGTTGGGATGGGGAGCTGCIATGGVCITLANSGTNSFCGQGGVTCATCSTNQNCVNYMCTGGTGGGGATGGGTGGGATGGGTGGGATGGGSGVSVGSPCTTSTQCASLGAGATCKTQTSPYQGNAPTAYPQGFCTLPCTGTGTCPNGATCAGGMSSIPYLFNEVDRFCTRSCSGPGQCTGGLECIYAEPFTLPNPLPGCWMTTGRTFTGGGLPSKAGIACTTDSQCENPPDPILAQCVTTLPGGYCLIDTGPEPSGAWCQSAGRSMIDYPLPDGGMRQFCTGTCSTVGQLAPNGRTGYTCFANSNGTGNVVWDACAVNTDCGGSVPFCNATTGFCCTDTTYANCATSW